MAGLAPQYDTSECAVCREDYQDPKLLRCGHIVCRKCVLSWLQTRGSQTGCPLCRAAIIPTLRQGEAALSADELAALIDRLPTDVAVMSVVECKKILKGDPMCSVCDECVSASTICIDCNIKLCRSCCKNHKKFPAFREHTLEDLSLLTPTKLAALRRSLCDVHWERPADAYCTSHHTFICDLCSPAHQECQTVADLVAFAQSERETLRNQNRNMVNIKAAVEEQMNQLEQNLRDVQALSNARKEAVKTMFERLIQAVLNRSQELLTSLQVESHVILSMISAERSVLKDYYDSIAAHIFVTDRLLSTAADGPLLKTLPNMKASLSALEAQTVAPLTKIEMSFVYFDAEVLSRLESVVAVFGQMSEPETEKIARNKIYCLACGEEVKNKKCKGLADHTPDRSDELELKLGHEFHRKINERWWQGSSGVNSGQFSSHHVQMITNENVFQEIAVLKTNNDRMRKLFENNLKTFEAAWLEIDGPKVHERSELVVSLKDLYSRHSSYREQFAEAAVNCGFAVFLLKMLKTMSRWKISKQSDEWVLTEATHFLVWNLSYSSEKLAVGLAEAGIVRILTSNLNRQDYLQALDIDEACYLLELTISILHNIVRCPGVKHFFHKSRTCEAIQPFLALDLPKFQLMKITATLILIYTRKHEEAKRSDDKAFINNIVRWLQAWLNRKVGSKFENFSSSEFLQALYKLGVKFFNKLKIVEAGALPLFLEIMHLDDVRGQAMSAKCLRTISFNKRARQQILELRGLLPALEALTESENPDVRNSAAIALWAIRGEGCNYSARHSGSCVEF